MKRRLETELMTDAAQVKAYAEADFAAPNQHFIECLINFIDNPAFCGHALDLGCGPGDISLRFVQHFTQAYVDALDGSVPMLDYAKAACPPALATRCQFLAGYIPTTALPRNHYEVIFSNSLLHHLPNPNSLWQTIKHVSQSGTRVVIMDLMRPESEQHAHDLVETYAKNEPAILQHDFYYSLLAAFNINEITDQLHYLQLPFTCQASTDRHLLITGVMP